MIQIDQMGESRKLKAGNDLCRRCKRNVRRPAEQVMDLLGGTPRDYLLSGDALHY